MKDNIYLKSRKWKTIEMSKSEKKLNENRVIQGIILLHQNLKYGLIS